MTESRLPAFVSAFPFVDLHDIALPQEGMLVARPSVCQRNYNRSGLCREHYERLAKASGRVAAPVQCPYGFASYSVFRDPVRVAFTGVIPYPRVGGELERAHAKRFPENRVAVSALEKGGTALLAAADRLGQLRLRP
jgi:hypothetical protein